MCRMPDAIRAEKQRQRTPEEKAILVSQWDETSMLMKKRNANPNEPEVVRARAARPRRTTRLREVSKSI